MIEIAEVESKLPVGVVSLLSEFTEGELLWRSVSPDFYPHERMLFLSVYYFKGYVVTGEDSYRRLGKMYWEEFLYMLGTKTSSFPVLNL